MEINDLIKNLAQEFEIDPAALTPSTSFRGMKEWSSMHALIVIALVNSEYDVIITGNDLMQINTVQDLFDMVVKRTQ
jgi:acyl carrier protein